MNVRHDMVAVFIARRDEAGNSHELLQLRRVTPNYMGGTWQTVSGKIKPGETAVQAALRELREETSFTPVEFYRLSRLDSFYTVRDDTIWHMPVFFALVGRDVAVTLNHEHDAHRWVSLEDSDAAFMWPTDRQSIDEIRWEILANGLVKPHLRIQMD